MKCLYCGRAMSWIGTDGKTSAYVYRCRVCKREVTEGGIDSGAKS